MAGRSDGSAIKALFPPSKGDPPTTKKKAKSPSSKNVPEESISSKSTPKNTPVSEKIRNTPSPHKNAPPPDQKKSSPLKNGSPPSDNDKKDSNENIWKAPPKIQVDVVDLLQRARAISSQVQEHGLLFNLEEVRLDQKKRTVSVFVVDKRSRKIVKPVKDMVLRHLSSLGVKVLAIIAGSSYAFWDILLPTEEEAVALTRKTLENKEYLFRTEYMGRRRTTVSVFEVPSFLRDANLAAFMLNFGDIVSATHDGMRGEWRFDLMLDAKTFYSVPNWLDVEGRRLPVIVSGRKPACWHCGEIGHLSAVCPGKKAPKKPDQNPGTPPPVVKNNEEKEAPVVSPTSAASKSPAPPTSSTVNSEEAGGEWLTVGKGGRKIQPADPHSRKSTQVGTNSSPTAKSYAQSSKPPLSSSKKFPPKTPPKQSTPPLVRSFSPGREKFEKLLEFKKRLDLQRKSTPQPGPSRSTPSSPKQPRTIRPPSTPPPKSMPPPNLTPLKYHLKKGPTPPPLPLESPPPPVATTASTSPSSSPKKRQRSPSIDSSGDEVPKHQKKERRGVKEQHHSGLNICRVDEGVLDRHHKVQPQLIKDLRVLHNFKEVNGKDVEDPRSFPDAWITSVIRKGRGSERAMRMLAEANEALGPISFIKDDELSCKGLIGRVPVVLHPSLYRAVKLTFPRDIGGLAHDGAITNEMATGSMSQTVGVLTPAMFSPGTQPL